MSKRGLVFVTTELYPFTGGGIGRFTYNVLKSLSASDLRRTTILLTHGKIAIAAFQTIFPGAKLFQLSEFPTAVVDSKLVSNPEDGWLTISVQILAVLRRMVATTDIEYLEFPDWSGLGFATIQEKHLTGFLWDTTIAVRVHSTEAILVLEESRLLRPADLRRFDIERKCYRDCDAIIAHLKPVSERTRVTFGFSEEEWNSRVKILVPPIEGNVLAPRAHSIIPETNTPIIFSSKFQEFKRPQVFIQGATHFLETNPDFMGEIVLACEGTQSDFAKSILNQIPPYLVQRFSVRDFATAEERDALIASGIVAFPTSFESFCFAAYEAAALGAVVVLNERNPAFGNNTPWLNGMNCIKFNGSAIELSYALSSCFQLSSALETVVPQRAQPPWEVVKNDVSSAWRKIDCQPLVSVIVVNQNEGILLRDTIDSILGSAYRNLELLVVDDGSTDAVSGLVVESLKLAGVERVTSQRLLVPMGRAAARNWGVGHIAGEYVMHVNSGDLIEPTQIQIAIECLENNGEFDIVVPQAAHFSDADRLSIDSLRISTFAGEAFVSGPVFNYFAASGWICRTALAKAYRFRPEAGYLDNWAWMLDVVSAGKRVVASPSVGVFIRDKLEHDLGTAISDYGKLRHLVVANTPACLSSFPVASLSALSQPYSTDVAAESWYRHMKVNSYEDEVEFMAKIFGHTWLGRLIRRNLYVSRTLEKLLRFLTGLR